MSARTPFAVRPAGRPITDPITKVGGQPVWLEQPQWPVSRALARPMWFIAQFEVPAGLAYVFLTDATDRVDDANDPGCGENAVIVQRDGRVPVLPGYVRDEPRPITVSTRAVGPTIAPDHVLVPAPDAADGYQFIGGEPRWIQNPEVPEAGYRLLAQLDSEKLPFSINFGDCGTGYVFLAPDGREGRFLWQN
jgi:hypothetical protein